MPEYVEVNGARVEKSYFEANLVEARALDWRPATISVADDHQHCLICDVSLPHDTCAHRADGRWVCTYCRLRFLPEGQQEET